MFLEQWSKYFDSESRNSEFYKIWATIGSNMEKTLLEELQRLESKTTDIMSFDEDMFRSWLAFFFAKIPCCISATTMATFRLNSGGPLNLLKGSTITSRDGYPYVLQEDVSITQAGTSITVLCVQGQEVTVSGEEYHNLIRVQAQNPDMNYLTVTVDGVEIPELSFQNSYNTLTFVGEWNASTNIPVLSQDDADFKKGWFYMVTQGGNQAIGPGGTPVSVNPGDFVVYNGEGWQKANDFTGLNFIQWNQNYAIPINGYFAYYYGGYLYIKVYPGVDVDNPEGKTWSITYLSSDGSKASVEKRSEAEGDDVNFTADTTASINIDNTASTPGIDQPDSNKLGLYLKQRIYSSTSLSTVSQYTDWFRAQPEIGDCIVVSDFELRQYNIETDLTGKVLIYALNNQGEQLDPVTQEMLYNRIQPFKDIATLEFVPTEPIYHFFAVEYRSSNNNQAFESYVAGILSNFYDINKVRSMGSSLFSEFDISELTELIMKNDTYNVVGLKITGYLYGERENPTSSSIYEIGGLPYSDVSVGDGFYLITDSDNNVLQRYDEFETVNLSYKTADIYLVNPQTLIPENNVSQGTITDYGMSVELDMTLTSPPSGTGNKLMGFMKPKNFNILPVESLYHRVLAGYSMKCSTDSVPRYTIMNQGEE